MTAGASNADIMERDGHRCARCGEQAATCHHRIHGNRADRRPSVLLAVCGDGTTGCHGWIEAHPRDSRTMGWTVSKHGRDPARVPVWMENGVLGRGWYLLADDLTIRLVEAA
jgi:hypothetical protein